MFIFFGTRRTTAHLGEYKISGKCPRCNNTINLQIVKETDWFTLYFIPVFPIHVARYKMCPICSVSAEISKEEAERLLEK
ncbi:MAG: zinc-ribbon domain-containing protein [Spirochaetaceae bacterium]|nr:zinc-ribbon domain-containing protein [Spirochaetaceae bacterium]